MTVSNRWRPIDTNRRKFAQCHAKAWPRASSSEGHARVASSVANSSVDCHTGQFRTPEEQQIAKVSIMLAALFWSALACAQYVPTATQWIGLFKEVHQHPLFKDLQVAYAKVPVVNVGDSPVGVMPRDGVDCVVVISEGDTTKLAQMMALTSSPEAARAFLMTIAAHEFGHCFRIRSGNLSVALWQRGLATAVGSPERKTFERTISIEEAYADA